MCCCTMAPIYEQRGDGEEVAKGLALAGGSNDEAVAFGEERGPAC